MALHLIDEVYLVLEKVKEKTGKPVEFVENNNLASYAVLKMARNNMPSHIIVYKKDHDEIINHLVVHECGHLLRMFSTSEEKRLIPYSDNKIKLNALSEIEGEVQSLSLLLPLDKLSHIKTLWYDGIVRQLTNYPSDIMIEKWIFNEHPALKIYQMKSIQKQLTDALGGLKDEVRKIMPQKILDASQIMNYAFFRILGLHVGTNFIRPYNNTQYVNRGKQLSLMTELEPMDTYENDIAMVNKWAEFLNLSNWFEWTGFENIPDNYLRQN